MGVWGLGSAESDHAQDALDQMCIMMGLSLDDGLETVDPSVKAVAALKIKPDDVDESALPGVVMTLLMAGFKLTKAMLDEAAAVLETERDKLKDDPDNGGDWAKGLAKQRLHVNHAELNAIGKAANNDGVLPDGGEQAIEHLLHTITEALFEEVHGHAKARLE